MKPVPWIRVLYMIVHGAILFLSVTKSACHSKSFNKDSRVSYAQFVRNLHTKLVVSSIKTLQVSTISECTLECINHRECVSVNYGFHISITHTCELINTDMFKQPDSLTYSADFHHYNIKVSCFCSSLLYFKAQYLCCSVMNRTVITLTSCYQRPYEVFLQSTCMVCGYV